MNRKKIIKRVSIGFGVFLIIALAALIAIPFIFKDEIVTAIKQGVNETLNARVDFRDVDLSLIRSFPNLSVRIEDYTVTGIDEFEGVDLVRGEGFTLNMSFWSIWNFGKEALEIKSVHLSKPEIKVIVLSNGKANYDIMKPTEDTTELQYVVKLKKYSLSDGDLVYDDRSLDFYLKAAEVNHSGVGDFTQDIFDLITETDIGKLDVSYGGLTYVKKAKAFADVAINIDLPNMKYTLEENEFTINDLILKMDGWIAMPADDIEMDLSFHAPQSDFKSLLSVVPNAYVKGYDDVKAEGTFEANGTAKGTYSDSPETWPALQINLSIANGNVKYPDLPLGISGINTSLTVNSPSSNLDQLYVDVSKFSLKIGSNPIEGYFKLKTPISDPDVDTKIKGVLNLEELSRAFPMEGVTTLNGMMAADVLIKTRMSVIDRADYANVNMNGNVKIDNLNYVAEGMPPVRVNKLQMDFSPKNVKMANFDVKLGQSDLNGSGVIDNLLAYFSPDATMKGSFILRSNYFNASEWMPEESNEVQPSGPPVVFEEPFNRFDLTLDAIANKVDYTEYKLENLVARGNLTPSRMTVNQLSGKIGESDFSASGELTNLWNYFFKGETLGGILSLRSSYMNLNQFITDSPSTNTSPTPTEPFLVPDNINMTLDAQMGKVIYDNMELNNLKGRLVVADEAVRFEDLSTQTLGGTMLVKGGYDTKTKDKPKFDFAMELQRFDFQQSFNTFNTFQVLAPIGKFVTGMFNTRLSISSNLKKDLMPDLTTINADGMLQTLQGMVKGFKPLEDVGNKLNVDAFKTITIKDSKNWFTVKDGTLELKEFDHSYQGIEMKIAGFHKLAGDMSYSILAKIPRDKIGKNPLGAAANSGLDFLSKEASKAGLDLQAGEFVNVLINIGGKISDPKLGFRVVGAEGKATFKEEIAARLESEVKGQVDSLKTVAQSKLEEEKKKLEDTLKTVVQQVKDDAAKKVEETTKKVGEEVKEKVGEEVKKQVGEEAKKKLEEINPLKKKKGGGGG